MRRIRRRDVRPRSASAGAAGRLGARLGALGIDARAARRSALIQLAAEPPAPVLADSLGIKIATASDWVKTAGGGWSNYAAATARTSR